VRDSDSGLGRTGDVRFRGVGSVIDRGQCRRRACRVAAHCLVDGLGEQKVRQSVDHVGCAFDNGLHSGSIRVVGAERLGAVAEQTSVLRELEHPLTVDHRPGNRRLDLVDAARHVDDERSDHPQRGDVLPELALPEGPLRRCGTLVRYWRHLGIGPDGFRLGRRVVYRRDDLERWVIAQRDGQAHRR